MFNGGDESRSISMALADFVIQTCADKVMIPNREKWYWMQRSTVTKKAGIDLRSWFILRFEIARTGSKSQFAKSGRVRSDRMVPMKADHESMVEV